jgi:hypothetical protein
MSMYKTCTAIFKELKHFLVLTCFNDVAGGLLWSSALTSFMVLVLTVVLTYFKGRPNTDLVL